jgi:hypothetical protein
VIIGVVLLFVVPAAVAFALLRPNGDGANTTQPTATTTPYVSPRPAVTGPGKEPPVAGEWPTGWATFSSTDPTRRNGIGGFTFNMPDTWDCARKPEPGAVSWEVCGAKQGERDAIGGDIVVRRCEGGECTLAIRDRMRLAEEAWGLQWTWAGSLLCWAESTDFIGSPRYGLVMVGYGRSRAKGEVNKEIVVRMTSPPEQAAELQKVANSIREAVGLDSER